jgi:hypothetical protein
MGNDTTGLFQTLVASASTAAESLKYQNAFLDGVYWEHRPDPVQPFTSLNVIIPTVNEADVTDIGSGAIATSDAKHNSVAVPFNKHFSTSFLLPTWDQARTPVQLAQKYLKPKLEGLMRKVNRTIAALVTTGNFSTYSLISGAGADEIVRADIGLAWQNLAAAGAPTEDDGNMFLIESVKSYGNQVADSNFINQYVVGENAAVQAQQRAKLVTQYGCEVRYDQHLAAYNAGKEPGILMHRYAIAAVTSPPPPSNDPSVKESIFKVKNVLPVQMQMQYSLKDQGTIVHLHCFWGVVVARPELGSLIESA